MYIPFKKQPPRHEMTDQNLHQETVNKSCTSSNKLDLLLCESPLELRALPCQQNSNVIFEIIMNQNRLIYLHSEITMNGESVKRVKQIEPRFK